LLPPRLTPVTQVADLFAFLAEQLADCETHWSLGTFGALAEFTRDADEPADLSQAGPALSAVTGRGAIRIAPPPGLRLMASETATRQSWNHRVALCLPERSCAMGGRGVLTELGPDTEALRAQDRAAILFDLGLSVPQVDACIRVADPQLAAALRTHVGRPVFEPGNPVMGIIVPASPHRVFVSRLGRIEVFQPIPPPNGKSPEGPHTHVLPKLLQHKRTHAATEPIPDGLVPCAHLYPAHPVKDALGRARPFDARHHERFQHVLGRFGDPGAVALKRRVIAAIEQGGEPSAIAVPDDRFARASVRVTLRQLQMANDQSPALAAWLAAHDRAQGAQPDETIAGHE
jgi:Family of unknown function (DUF6925)